MADIPPRMPPPLPPVPPPPPSMKFKPVGPISPYRPNMLTRNKQITHKQIFNARTTLNEKVITEETAKTYIDTITGIATKNSNSQIISDMISDVVAYSTLIKNSPSTKILHRAIQEKLQTSYVILGIKNSENKNEIKNEIKMKQNSTDAEKEAAFFIIGYRDAKYRVESPNSDKKKIIAAPITATTITAAPITAAPIITEYNTIRHAAKENSRKTRNIETGMLFKTYYGTISRPQCIIDLLQSNKVLQSIVDNIDTYIMLSETEKQKSEKIITINTNLLGNITFMSLYGESVTYTKKEIILYVFNNTNYTLKKEEIKNGKGQKSNQRNRLNAIRKLLNEVHTTNQNAIDIVVCASKSNIMKYETNKMNKKLKPHNIGGRRTRSKRSTCAKRTRRH